jgi:hypothetical protein
MSNCRANDAIAAAAAVYNAAPTRVRDWVGGRRTLPSETKTYARIVTVDARKSGGRRPCFLI